MGEKSRDINIPFFLPCSEGFSVIQLVMAFQLVMGKQCPSAVMRSAGNGSPRLMNTWGGCGSFARLREGIEIVKYTLQFSLGLTNHKKQQQNKSARRRSDGIPQYFALAAEELHLG